MNGMVRYQKGMTLQPEPYNSVSVQLAFELPIEDGETPEEAAIRIGALVDDILQVKAEEALANWKGK